MPQEQKNTTLREKYNLTRNAKYAAMHMVPQEQKNTRNKKRKLAARAGRKR
jgi:hypothetical protein